MRFGIVPSEWAEGSAERKNRRRRIESQIRGFVNIYMDTFRNRFFYLSDSRDSIFGELQAQTSV